MTIKEQLHHLIEELPDSELVVAERVLSALRDTAETVREWHIDDAPEEEPTPEESEAITEAEARIAKGERLVPHEEVRRRVFGANSTPPPL